MHIPDGFIDGGTSAAAGAIAVGGLGLSVRRTAKVLDEKQVPLAGVVSAFIFAIQMLNFPVVGGTSGHLLGGVLAAVLVGPWMGSLCVALVLFVQAQPRQHVAHWDVRWAPSLARWWVSTR